MLVVGQDHLFDEHIFRAPSLDKAHFQLGLPDEIRSLCPHGIDGSVQHLFVIAVRLPGVQLRELRNGSPSLLLVLDSHLLLVQFILFGFEVLFDDLLEVSNVLWMQVLHRFSKLLNVFLGLFTPIFKLILLRDQVIPLTRVGDTNCD